MKSFISLLLLLLVLLSISTSVICAKKKRTFENLTFQPNLLTSPPYGDFLDLSTTKVKLLGYQLDIYDTSPKIPIADVTSAETTVSLNIFDNEEQKVIFDLGPGFIAYVNSTNNFQTINYSGEIFCFNVPNYNYADYIQYYSALRFFYTVQQTTFATSINLLGQLIETYGFPTLSESCNLGDFDLFDIYQGMYVDSSAPGPNSGCQKQYLSGSLLVSRIGKGCWNKTIIVDYNYFQFFVGLAEAGLSPRNLFQGSIFATKITSPQPSDYTYYNTLINNVCQNAVNYCTGYFNTQCPFPSISSNPACGVSKKSTIERMYQERMKAKKQRS